MKKYLLLILLALFFSLPICEGADEFYVNPEASVTWTDTGGDELLDAGGLAADAVVMGSFSDLGSGAHAENFNIEVTIDGFDTAPVVGEAVDIWISTSNATTNFDGNPTTDPTTTAEGTMTTAQLDNSMRVGSLIVYSTTAGDELKTTFQNFSITSRYVSVIIHNNTADALLSTSDAHKIVLIPSSIQAQP